jgi:TrmH family RNA methyltransferase
MARAIEAGIRPIEAFDCDALHDPIRTQAVLSAIRAAGAEILPVTREVFSKLCFGDRNEIGVVLVAESVERRLEDVRLPSFPLVAVVETVEKPGNLGAILRSADAAGIDAVVIADGATDLFNPNTIRASLGTVFRENVVAASAKDTIGWLEANGLRAIAARPDAKMSYTSADFCGRVAIVLGGEATGLSDIWREAVAETVQLPMHGIADSLNVSTTAAVLFYEAIRQRGESARQER